MTPTTRSAARIQGPTDADHPGELDDSVHPIAGLAIDYLGASVREWHHHKRGQLLYAVSGVMQVETSSGNWIVAPEQAVWIPPTVSHCVSHQTSVLMRTLYIDTAMTDGLPATCAVVAVKPLLQQLILRATEIGVDYLPDTPPWRLMMVILDELRGLDPEPMHLPLPDDLRLTAICRALYGEPADNRTLAQWASTTSASERTLARLFVDETGMTFGAWRERLRLMVATRLLVEGESVTRVALDVGYSNTSAFIAMFRRNLDQSPAQFVRRTTTTAVI